MNSSSNYKLLLSFIFVIGFNVHAEDLNSSTPQQGASILLDAQSPDLFMDDISTLLQPSIVATESETSTVSQKDRIVEFAHPQSNSQSQTNRSSLFQFQAIHKVNTTKDELEAYRIENIEYLLQEAKRKSDK